MKWYTVEGFLHSIFASSSTLVLFCDCRSLLQGEWLSKSTNSWKLVIIALHPEGDFCDGNLMWLDINDGFTWQLILPWVWESFYNFLLLYTVLVIKKLFKDKLNCWLSYIMHFFQNCRLKFWGAMKLYFLFNLSLMWL